MFLICGEALFDVFVRESAGNALALDAVAGGSPFNVAIGLARLGSRAALLTGLSNDLLGRHLTRRLDAEGVETRFLVTSNRRTTLSLVATDSAGIPSYTFYGIGSADRHLELADIAPLRDEFSAIHCGSYTLVVPPIADAIAALITREHGRRLISLDPNVRPTVEPDMAIWRARLDNLLPMVDVVKVSEEDLAHLYPGADPATACREWQARGPALIVLTLGPAGAIAFSAGATARCSSPSITVADTVGAGDAFQAALLNQLDRLGALTASHVARITEPELSRILGVCTGAAALTCTRRGADLPRRHDLIEQ